MGFFAEFNRWLAELLLNYVANSTARIADAIEPLVVTLGVLYIIVWGYLQLAGKIDEPLVVGVRRLIVLALILGFSLQLWSYNEIIVDSFFSVPGDLAAYLVGGFDSILIVDEILFRGDEAGTLLMSRGGFFKGDFSYYFAGIAVYLIVGMTAIYTMFLLTLSRIALSVLLALGPIFICLLMFESTKRFFEAWIAQLANYALISVLAVAVAALMMRVVAAAAAQATSVGGAIEVAHAVRVCLAAGITFLVLRQVMPIAAGLASGLALSTFGLVSAGMKWGLGSAKRGLGQFSRGLSDNQTTRWDSLSRKAGYYVRRGVVGSARALGQRENAIRRA